MKAADECKDKATAPNQLWQTGFTYLKVIGWGLSILLRDRARPGAGEADHRPPHRQWVRHRSCRPGRLLERHYRDALGGELLLSRSQNRCWRSSSPILR
jgi:hypothetical protein